MFLLVVLVHCLQTFMSIKYIFLTALPCPDPGVPLYGIRTGIVAIGETVTYKCTKRGYELFGPANRTCIFKMGKGNDWTGYLPVCKGRFRLISCIFTRK